MDSISPKILKELKMNGLVNSSEGIIYKMDAAGSSLPVAFNKDGGLRKGASAATREQFRLLNQYVKNKIQDIRSDILSGDAQVSPYELGKKMPVPTASTREFAALTKRSPDMSTEG